MNTELALKVSNLSKTYLLGKKKEESLRSSLSNLFNFKNTKSDIFNALKNLNFEVKKGDVIGIIGRNGAGKSTLLKIISQITKPTSGRIEINGRIASLLEVGTGFHPELTGRENIYLNGTILGMTRKEVKAKFDEIVEFSGVEKFIDTAVKHYSSGMYVRLAFAVAAHLEPEILIIDEVLAVGDAEFQKKCLGKMKDVAGEGRTVFFVSHNMSAVKTLCNKAIFLNKGEIEFFGDIETAISKYYKNDEKSASQENFKKIHVPNIFEISSIRVYCEDKEYSEIIDENDSFLIETVLDVLDERSQDYTVTYHVLNEHGEALFSTSSLNINLELGNNKLICKVPGNFFQSGSYSLSLFYVYEKRECIFLEHDVKEFTINDGKRELGSYMGREPGSIKPNFPWTNLVSL